MINSWNYAITGAFNNSRTSAQDDIEDLAERTGGKAFFVPNDSGPEVINNALEGEEDKFFA